MGLTDFIRSVFWGENQIGNIWFAENALQWTKKIRIFFLGSDLFFAESQNIHQKRAKWEICQVWCEVFALISRCNFIDTNPTDNIDLINLSDIYFVIAWWWKIGLTDSLVWWCDFRIRSFQSVYSFFFFLLYVHRSNRTWSKFTPIVEWILYRLYKSFI